MKLFQILNSKYGMFGTFCAVVCLAGCTASQPLMPQPSSRFQTPIQPRPITKSIGFYHTVQKGETLSSIARKYKSTVGILAEKNRLPDTEHLDIGQMLYIPHNNGQ
ncbi:MAG: LysM peptidoglycan-binding domain-containing protein [Candidatus Omnitrophica bacterium]|nr:LysM peptidoglycan-binding domain-containing protein [Candidatus Omnitrophota bacterium]